MLLEYSSMTANYYIILYYKVMLYKVICFSTGLFPALRTSLITLGFVFFFSLQLQEPLVMRAKSLWLSQTLCDPMEPARLLCPWNSPGKNTEAVATSFSRGSSQPRDQMHISCIGRWDSLLLSHRESHYKDGGKAWEFPRRSHRYHPALQHTLLSHLNIHTVTNMY